MRKDWRKTDISGKDSSQKSEIYQNLDEEISLHSGEILMNSTKTFIV